MAEYVTFEKGECSLFFDVLDECYRNPNANMAESDFSEIEERINPKLLRAIVNGDLNGFNKIVRMKEPIDIESIGQVSLRGVTSGGNTALHVVAGVMEKSSSTETLEKFMNILVSSNEMSELTFVYPPIIISVLTSRLITDISRLTEPLIQSFLFVFSKKKFRAAEPGDVPFPRTNLHVVNKFLTVNTQWIQTCLQAVDKSFRVIAQWKDKKNNELIEKARRTRWLKWVFPLPNVSVLPKRKRYMEIAKIIYRLEPTLLNAHNNASKETPLHCAVKAGKLEMVSLLVNFAWKDSPQKLKEVLWARNKVGETALHEAARSGYSGVVKELLGADENLARSVDLNGISPLYLAVAAGCLDVVDMLLASCNCQPGYAGPDKQTAFHAAVMTQEENIMRVILEWKPDIAAKADKAQNTPLHYATLIGNTYAVKQLLLKDTKSVYKANLSGSFPVHLAAEAGNFKVIKELIRICPDVGEQLDNEKRNFLHIAVEKKMLRVIMLANKEGINANVMNAKDKNGNTPLHLAVISSETEIFALLCQNKRVNPHIRNEAGLTPLDLSASLQDHQFTYTLNPQSIIHRVLVTRGAFQNPCQPDLSKKVNDFLKARADCQNRREGKEMWNGVEVDIEKESIKYENMSKSLITGAVLIASATFVSIFTVSGVYRSNNTPHTLSRRNFFKAFIIVNIAAFICAIVTTIWLLYSALSNFHLKYRKFYFQWCTLLLHVAINLFILTFGLGAYIAIAPLSEWLAVVILVISGITILWNVIWNPSFIPLILLAPYMPNEHDQ